MNGIESKGASTFESQLLKEIDRLVLENEKLKKENVKLSQATQKHSSSSNGLVNDVKILSLERDDLLERLQVNEKEMFKLKKENARLEEENAAFIMGNTSVNNNTLLEGLREKILNLETEISEKQQEKEKFEKERKEFENLTEELKGQQETLEEEKQEIISSKTEVVNALKKSETTVEKLENMSEKLSSDLKSLKDAEKMNNKVHKDEIQKLQNEAKNLTHARSRIAELEIIVQEQREFSESFRKKFEEQTEKNIQLERRLRSSRNSDEEACQSSVVTLATSLNSEPMIKVEPISSIDSHLTSPSSQQADVIIFNAEKNDVQASEETSQATSNTRGHRVTVESSGDEQHVVEPILAKKPRPTRGRKKKTPVNEEAMEEDPGKTISEEKKKVKKRKTKKEMLEESKLSNQDVCQSGSTLESLVIPVPANQDAEQVSMQEQDHIPETSEIGKKIRKKRRTRKEMQEESDMSNQVVCQSLDTLETLVEPTPSKTRAKGKPKKASSKVSEDTNLLEIASENIPPDAEAPKKATKSMKKVTKNDVKEVEKMVEEGENLDEKPLKEMSNMLQVKTPAKPNKGTSKRKKKEDDVDSAEMSASGNSESTASNNKPTESNKKPTTSKKEPKPRRKYAKKRDENDQNKEILEEEKSKKSRTRRTRAKAME